MSDLFEYHRSSNLAGRKRRREGLYTAGDWRNAKPQRKEVASPPKRTEAQASHQSLISIGQLMKSVQVRE